MKRAMWRKGVVSLLSVAIINLGLVGSAAGAIVDTETLVTSNRNADMAIVRAQLDREEVRQQLKELGVEASSVESRIASLSDSELHQLAQNMQNAPAGGDLLAIIGVTFVVLLILELVGVIDIFKQVPR
ncbi:MAG: PA2779 family protein [Steroidobacteraceae bacterium]|nr:PA2779 family protein [Steroidobacteraceae bacterium]